jgi:YebC/PmpR family DNA-binding regulatory protein
MWRGPVIERQKQATAKERWKVFAIHAKLIAIAAAKWADPSQNAALAEAIAKARKENVPNDNIDRAVKRGSGQEKGAAQIEEVTYEGYAAGWVAVIIKALTDNRNRTAPNIRHAFSKCSANLGETGSVSNFAFRYVGEIVISWTLDEAMEEIIMESGASDYFEQSGELIIITQWNDFAKVRNFLVSQWLEITSAEGTYLPTTTVEVSEFDKALKVHTLIETLEEDEDVEAVWHNALIPQNLQEEIIAHIESHRFRT